MAASQPSQDQLHLATVLGIDISADTFDVAAARLLDRVASAIGYEPAGPSSERQRAFAESLGYDVTLDSKRVASAKIGEALLANNLGAIKSLNLQAGDRVIRVTQFEHAGEFQSFEQEFVVSSIQSNGRVFFKGGNGQGAWPTQLKKPAP
ncbi:MAG TPA: hypothetical protein PK743_10140 [Luteimonas sp.]|nr:hypothetical protein [Luteimonas sp.]HRP72981.1 hypothetical protein [Luteimonas sp.]